jgi:hypothetical protein
VKSACIKDRGRPGKGPKVLPKLKEGSLTQFGYSMKSKSRSRHTALNKAVKKFGAASVSRKLNVLAIYNKNTSPKTARTARSDRKYVMKSRSK